MTSFFSTNNDNGSFRGSVGGKISSTIAPVTTFCPVFLVSDSYIEIAGLWSLLSLERCLKYCVLSSKSSLFTEQTCILSLRVHDLCENIEHAKHVTISPAISDILSSHTAHVLNLDRKIVEILFNRVSE
jgi:hypothetical protein